MMVGVDMKNMNAALHVVVDGEHARQSFGMLTAHLLAPEANIEQLKEFVALPVEERVCVLAATWTMWNVFAGDAAVLGAYGGSVETALRETRAQTDGDYRGAFPSAVMIANRFDDALSLRGLTFIEPELVDEIGDCPAHSLGALGYFLRAASIALCACAVQRGCSISDLLALVGQRLALSA